jgi:hypothetical protein
VLTLTASVTPSFSNSSYLTLNAAAGLEPFFDIPQAVGDLATPNSWWLLVLVAAHLVFG